MGRGEVVLPLAVGGLQSGEVHALKSRCREKNYPEPGNKMNNFHVTVIYT